MSDKKTLRKKPDNLPLAIVVIIFTVFALSLGDALIKLGSSTFVIWQIFVLRSLIAIPVLIVTMGIWNQSAFQLAQINVWIFIRSLLLVAMWISYYIALPQLSLSIAAAAYYTLPIFITLFSALLVGENISSIGWFSVALGFVGVLLILKPDSGDFNWYALLPILSAILYALAMIITRTRCRSVHSLMLSLALNLSFVVIGCTATLLITTIPADTIGDTAFLTGPWSAMNFSDWISMGLLAIAILIGSIGAAIAYQNGPPSIVGVFDFGYVGFAVLWSMLLFGNYPDLVSITGILLIVIAGIISITSGKA